jgi:hypothetical protein
MFRGIISVRSITFEFLRSILRNLAFIFLLLGWQYCTAQYGCIDSSAINPSFQCAQTEFDPVCGCDNETYRNKCEAGQKYGVQTYYEGSCSGFEIDIIPTFDPSNLYFTLVQSDPHFTRLFIVDMYGKRWWEKEIAAVPREYFQIDITMLSVGTYILYVYDSKDTYRYKRFTRMPL